MERGRGGNEPPQDPKLDKATLERSGVLDRKQQSGLEPICASARLFGACRGFKVLCSV
jgi:hypothetical protein